MLLVHHARPDSGGFLKVSMDLLATWIAVLLGCLLCGTLGFLFEASKPIDSN